MKRWGVPLSIGMLVLYAALAVGAANCLTLHADQPGAHHHGQSHLAHSALCAWACQLNPAAIVGTPPSLVAISSVMAGVGHADLAASTALLCPLCPSRAPPIL
ncbi:MAG TPA: hypothetical protein VFL19_06355 [Nitrospira sp.]|nr:hypothetical protein [Nitrospira sp.]